MFTGNLFYSTHDNNSGLEKVKHRAFCLENIGKVKGMGTEMKIGELRVVYRLYTEMPNFLHLLPRTLVDKTLPSKEKIKAFYLEN